MNTNQMNRTSASPSAVADAPRKKPVHELRLGLIKAAIWENTVGENLLRYNVTFARIYKTESEWKASDTFGRDDLLVLAKVADQAHSWICSATKADRELAR
jgi:hypothetical protein